MVTVEPKSEGVAPAKPTPTPVTIGVAVRYETPASLKIFVERLSRAAKMLDAQTDAEVCICVNGATVDTRRSVQDAVARYSHPELHFRCIESPPGKIVAHRQIAAERRLQGHLLFVDADLGYEQETFLRLYQRLTATPRLWACHAEVLASASVARGWFAAAQNAYYRCRSRAALRKHLHGRCFILREWLPELAAMRSTMADDGMEEPGPLRLELGPIVDDIHYSRAIAARFGHDAIGCDADAVVRFVPPHSWRELYKDSCRTEIELARLDALFPEHCHCEAKVFRVVSDRAKILRTFSESGALAASYLALEMGMRALARHRIRTGRATLAEGGICPTSVADADQPGHPDQLSNAAS
ncbi:hypothetical protein THIOKS1860002 [Thiocapsa sp. KS1]|nr:glycosyltransferase family A protein [Thiocapsa sp. KS1]CRI67833.1 hypothetical protein THIOKS1860002 [Thiocapsa sp. KS1]